MTRLSLTLLGDFQAQFGSGPPLRLRARKTQALLAYLALPAGQAHSRDKLAALLWGDGSQHHARSRLRETLFVLRRALAPADTLCLDAGNETVALTADAVDVDAVAFERLVETGGAVALGDAVDLYRGDLLEGLEFRGALFEDWLMAERERLRELALDALAKLLAHHRSAGLAEPALQTALRLIALDPLQEAVHRTLMRLYAQLGRRGSALRQYQLCVGVLRRELGVEPEADTRSVYQEILRHRAGTGTPGGKRSQEGGSSPGTLGAQPLTIPTEIPLIGREPELARGRAALVEAQAGRGQLMLVLGEAGVGKTRLIGELSAEAYRRESHVLLGRCHEGEQILPFGPWVDALRAGRIPEQIGGLADLAPSSRSELARLLPELDASGVDRGPPNYLKVFESMAQLLACLSRVRPLLLILEDLHWADEMSIRLLAFLARRISSWPAIVVMTARQDELIDAPVLRRTLQDLSRAPHVVYLDLAPLSRAETVRLVRTVAPRGRDGAALARLTEQVWSTSAGNPFVVVETTRALEEGTIVGDSTARPLPKSVRELVAGRLERLSDRARELASVAAVFGRAFDFPLLHRAGGLDEHTTAEALEELVRRQVLGGVGEGFDFSHDRVRAVVYDQLLPPQRTLRHRRAGEALEVLHADNLEPHLLALGVHFREGEVWDRAVDFFHKAGTAAMARSAYREALSCFEQALAITRRLPESARTPEREIDLRLDLRMSLHPLGELERGLGHLHDAERLARTLKDQSRLGWVSVYLSHFYCLKKEPTEARRFGQTALTIGEAWADFRLAVAASFYLGMISNSSGDYQGAGGFYHMGLRALGGDRSRERCGLAGFPAVMVRARLAQVLATRGEFQQGMAHGQEAIRIAEQLDHPYSLIMACYTLGFLHVAKGDLSDATRLLERGLTLSDTWNIRLWSPTLLVPLCNIHARSGRVSEAISLLRSTAKEFESIYHRPETEYIITLGEVYVLAGQSDEALSLAGRGLAFARERGLRGVEASALHLRAEIASHGDPPSSAESGKLYTEALALAKELGMRPLAARCHLGLGRLYRQAGQGAAAKEHLSTARTMLAEMEMRFWLEQAEAELTLT